MAKQRKTAYCFLSLMAFLLVFAMVLLSVGNTRAYYKNQVFWNTIVQPEQTVASNCLLPGGQTILLGEVTEESWIEIQFQAQGAVDGVLSYDLVDSEQWDYLEAELSDEEISLDEGAASVYLRLTPTGHAATLWNDMDVDILVTLEVDGQTLEGIFRATLPAIEQPEDEEPEPPSEGETEPPSEGETEPPSEGETEPPSEGETEPPSEGETEPPSEGETEPPSEGETEPPSEGETEPPSEGEPESPNEGEHSPPNEGEPEPPSEGEPEPPSEGETEPPSEGETEIPGEDSGTTEDGTTEDGTTEVPPAIVPVVDPATLHAGDFEMSTLKDFSLKAPLPIALDIPDDTARVTVNLSDDDLPAFTRYSTDGGENWYMLYYGGEIDIDVYESALFTELGMSLLLDLSYTDWDSTEPLYLFGKAYTDGGWYTGTVLSMPHAMLFSTRTSRSPMVLTEDKPLALPLTESWAECGERVTLERLTAQNSDASRAEYEEIFCDSINVSLEDASVTVSVGDSLPEAGTYRLTIEYSYGDIYFAQSQITFFVNYSGQTGGL